VRLELWLFALVLALPAQGGVAAVWAASDGDKIERDELRSPLKAGNGVWNGSRVRLVTARNEVVAFQVIVEADEAGIDGLRVSLPELRNGESRIAYAAPDADPTRYAGRPIQLFSVHYMHVEQATKASWIYKLGTPSAPRDPLGWKPVQLVPENARAGRGGFPLKVAPGSGQSVWIEIYTGRGRPAGVYKGEVTVRAGSWSRALPVELELLDFTLPDENSMDAMVFFEGDQPELYMGQSLHPAFHRFARRHRIELVHAYDEASVEKNFGRFDGSDFTAARGYEGPGEKMGYRIVPRTFYGPNGFTKKEEAWPSADRWMTFLRQRLPKALTFLYLPDEPYPQQYGEVRKLADMLHANPGPGGKLPLFLTHEYVKALDGVADYWCSGPEGFKIDTVKRERARGREYWIYNGGRPAGGAVVIDAPATDPRALIWGCFKHDISLYFYWHANHWRHNNQKPRDRVQNVWSNPITFDNRGQPNKPVEHQSFANGDGVLIYPGMDKLHPAEDRGVPGPVGTIQLANFRRGLQDHQYLTLARKCGAEAEVREALEKVVPRMFSDAGETVGFSESAAEYDAAREKLGRAIARGCRQ
jgi:hypothetical protein